MSGGGEKMRRIKPFFSLCSTVAPNSSYDIRKPLPKQQRDNCTEKNTHTSLLSAAGAGAPGGGCGGRASITVTCLVFCWVSRGERRRANFSKTVSGRRPVYCTLFGHKTNNNNSVENVIQVVRVCV